MEANDRLRKRREVATAAFVDYLGRECGLIGRKLDRACDLGAKMAMAYGEEMAEAVRRDAAARVG